jgi:NADH-quinone oxidoreductase subunit N
MASDLSSLGALGPVLPEIILAIAALVLLLVGVLALKREQSGVLSGVAIVVLLLLAVYVGVVGGTEGLLFNGGFIDDGFARFMKTLALGGSCSCFPFRVPPRTASPNSSMRSSSCWRP